MAVEMYDWNKEKFVNLAKYLLMINVSYKCLLEAYLACEFNLNSSQYVLLLFDICLFTDIRKYYVHLLTFRFPV